MLFSLEKQVRYGYSFHAQGVRHQFCLVGGNYFVFVTLEEDTEVLYKVTNYYAPSHDRGVLWNDPALEIPWPVSPDEAIISEKDGRLPTLAEAEDLFASEAIGRIYYHTPYPGEQFSQGFCFPVGKCLNFYEKFVPFAQDQEYTERVYLLTYKDIIIQ